MQLKLEIQIGEDRKDPRRESSRRVISDFFKAYLKIFGYQRSNFQRIWANGGDKKQLSYMESLPRKQGVTPRLTFRCEVNMTKNTAPAEILIMEYPQWVFGDKRTVIQIKWTHSSHDHPAMRLKAHLALWQLFWAADLYRETDNTLSVSDPILGIEITDIFQLRYLHGDDAFYEALDRYSAQEENLHKTYLSKMDGDFLARAFCLPGELTFGNSEKDASIGLINLDAFSGAIARHLYSINHFWWDNPDYQDWRLKRPDDSPLILDWIKENTCDLGILETYQEIEMDENLWRWEDAWDIKNEEECKPSFYCVYYDDYEYNAIQYQKGGYLELGNLSNRNCYPEDFSFSPPSEDDLPLMDILDDQETDKWIIDLCSQLIY